MNLRAHRVALVAGWLYSAALAAAAPAAAAPLQALAELDLASYAGTWYQVALYPNAFQRQCVSDTSATYTLQSDVRGGRSSPWSWNLTRRAR